MSIVLAVISLTVAAVVVGQSLINSARLDDGKPWAGKVVATSNFSCVNHDYPALSFYRNDTVPQCLPYFDAGI
jgi:hypothetical protein